MKYFFPLKLGSDRIHCCWLEQEAERTNNLFHFIVPSNKERIFSVTGRPDDNLLLPDNAELSPRSFSDSKLFYLFNSSENKICIYISPETEPENSIESISEKEYKALPISEKRKSFFLLRNEKTLENKNEPDLPKKEDNKGLQNLFKRFRRDINSSENAESVPKSTSRNISANIQDKKDPLQIELRIPDNIDFLNKSYTVEIEFSNDGIKFRNSFIVHISEPDHIYDAAIDFGSEVSQIATGRRERGSDKSREIIWTFRNFKDNYSTLINKDDSGFYQYEISNGTSLFRSLFFISNPQNALKEFRHEFKNRTYDKEINLLFHENETATGKEIMPILKIAMLGGNREYLDSFSEFNNEEEVKTSFYVYVVLRFCRMIIQKIDKDASSGSSNFIKFHILIPNFYNQEYVYKLLLLFNDGIKEILKNREKLKGFEVQLVNESDTAFIGSKDKLNCAADKKYLIIDVGKGTTDISVIKTLGNDHEFEKVFSTGMIGAGQYLSTIFFNALLRLLFNDETERQLLKTEIQKSDFVTKDKFQKLIDTLKHNYGNSDGSVVRLNKENKLIASLIGSDSIKQEKGDKKEYSNFCNEITDTLNPNGLFTLESTPYIEKNIESFTDEIVGQIPSNYSYEKVLLTGRGMLLKIFRDKLTEKIMSHLQGVTEIFSPKELDLKQCSIRGPFDRSIDLSSDSDLLNTIEWGDQELNLKHICTGRMREDNSISPRSGQNEIRSGNVSYRPDNQYLNSYYKEKMFIFFNGQHFFAYNKTAKKVFPLLSQQANNELNNRYLNETLFPFFKT